MQSEGGPIEGLEHGNAWALRDPSQPATNWLLGDHAGIPADSLRFLPQLLPGGRPAMAVENLALKWFEHRPSDDPSWGENKPLSTGRTLSLLAGSGAFELRFRRGGHHCRLLLDQPGDFALWGEGLEHSWRALKPSTVLTLRWSPQAQEGTGADGGRAAAGSVVQGGEC